MDDRVDYRALTERHPDLFRNPPGAAFEILLDEADIRRAEERMATQLGAVDWRPGRRRQAGSSAQCSSPASPGVMVSTVPRSCSPAGKAGRASDESGDEKLSHGHGQNAYKTRAQIAPRGCGGGWLRRPASHRS
jgi:hypothetical protein